jgi:hypothetical protein
MRRITVVQGWLATRWAKIVPSALCVLALAIYGFLAPSPTYSDPACQCVYAGQGYSNGACRGGQRCSCNGDSATWYDDSTCKDKVALVEGDS